MKLCIISHTEHYKNPDGSIVGWGPTINEINHLTKIFDEIYHLAMLQKDDPPPSALPYTSNKITFVELPAVGGRTFSAKLNIALSAPKTIKIVANTLKKVDCFQLRTPTGIGVFLIPYLTLFVKKKGWFKYAGNWNQKNAPLGYALQRFMLKKQNRKVTINGKWQDQPKQCITFENPCLTNENISEGKRVIQEKDYSNKLTFCFVGRLEREKGVERIIRAFTNLNIKEKQKVASVQFVGEGKELSFFKQIAQKSEIKMLFHGALAREDVFKIYKKSHAFLLPSTASEGFPKVIAEALNFGCLPIVSNVSSVGQYIKHNENGLLVFDMDSNNLQEELSKFLSFNEKRIKKMLFNNGITELFSFKHYNNSIINKVLN